MQFDLQCQGSELTWRAEQHGRHRDNKFKGPPAQPNTLQTITRFLHNRNCICCGDPMSCMLLSAHEDGNWVRFLLMSPSEELIAQDEGYITKAWHGSRLEMLYFNLMGGNLMQPPEKEHSWCAYPCKERTYTDRAPGAHFYADESFAVSQAESEMTWVELRGDDVYFGIMFEALVDTRLAVQPPGYIWPRSYRWAQPRDSYRLLALWVCGSHISTLPQPKYSTVGLPWEPKREVNPWRVISG